VTRFAINDDGYADLHQTFSGASMLDCMAPTNKRPLFRTPDAMNGKDAARFWELAKPSAFFMGLRTVSDRQ